MSLAWPSHLTDAASARTTLVGKITDADPFATPASELAELRLAAAREVFAERRTQIPLLERRAQEGEVRSIRSLADLVPLLFSHTTYKSYPLSFIARGQWPRLLAWFAALSAVPVNNVNLDGVGDIDDFIGRLWEAGHVAVTTSGTSGKVSFLHRVQADNELFCAYVQRHYGWPGKITPACDRHFFQLTPKFGPYMLMTATRIYLPLFARPDSQHFLSEGALSIAYLMRAADMRRRMGEGTATPTEIAAFENDAKRQVATTADAFARIADQILTLRHEPMMLIGQWGMLWRLLQRAREQGVADGEFHPDTVVGGGGGLKGLALPFDYESQIRRFLGPCLLRGTYGMSEMSVPFSRCEAGRFHTIPWIIPLVLDATGERLLDTADGPVSGRFAFLDLSCHARWGGMITGDKVTMDFGNRCVCARPGPTLLPPIARYADLGEDDKIGCAGSIEAYIRGHLDP